MAAAEEEEEEEKRKCRRRGQSGRRLLGGPCPCLDRGGLAPCPARGTVNESGSGTAVVVVGGGRRRRRREPIRRHHRLLLPSAPVLPCRCLAEENACPCPSATRVAAAAADAKKKRAAEAAGEDGVALAKSVDALKSPSQPSLLPLPPQSGAPRSRRSREIASETPWRLSQREHQRRRRTSSARESAERKRETRILLLLLLSLNSTERECDFFSSFFRPLLVFF